LGLVKDNRQAYVQSKRAIREWEDLVAYLGATYCDPEADRPGSTGVQEIVIPMVSDHPDPPAPPQFLAPRRRLLLPCFCAVIP